MHTLPLPPSDPKVWNTVDDLLGGSSGGPLMNIFQDFSENQGDNQVLSPNCFTFNSARARVMAEQVAPQVE